MPRSWFIRFAASVWATAFTALAGELAAEPLATVSVASLPGSSTGGIQEAIDSLGPAGGVVTIPPGVYLLRRSIRVRSGITLAGSGEKTVLRKANQAGSRLAAAGKEDRAVRVENATGLRVGDEIAIFDGTTVGWEHSHAVIKEIRGNELLLDRRIARDFDPANGAAVINYFPAITGTRVYNVVLRNLTIDGNAAENPGPAAVAPRAAGKPPELGFQFAAVNLVDVADTVIEGLHVCGWPADGISLQRGSGNRVSQCVVEGCRGEGFHPGGGLHDSQFSRLIGRENLANGFYFCARVERVAVRDSQFLANRKNGVGGLGDSGDKDNLVEKNVCARNGQCGIQLFDGESNTVKANTCQNNSQSSPGKFSGIVLAATSRSIVSGNRCFDDQERKTQKFGIEETANCQANAVSGNDCSANAQAGMSLKGRDHQESGRRD